MSSATALAKHPARRDGEKSSSAARKPGGRSPVRIARQPVSPLALQAMPRPRLAPKPQAALEVNRPGDTFEQEAEAVAARVASQPHPDVVGIANAQNPRGPQRQAAGEEQVQRQARDEEQVQRQASPEDQVRRQPAPEEQVQRADKGGKPRVSSRTAATIHNPGQGAPMAQGVRARIEPHLGADLGGVRVHTDVAAAQAASSLSARAFTFGNHIFLNRTESPGNVRLMAHEATHTVQQGAVVGRLPQAAPAGAAPAEIQRLPAFIGEELDKYARYIPGYTLFTVIIGFNPLTGAAVERNGMNLVGGLMGLVPFGTAVFDKLSELGILQDALAWVEGELSRLNLSLSRIEQTIEAAWEDVSLTSGWDYNLGVLERHFTPLYNDVVAFVGSLVSHLIELIKEAAIGAAEGLLADNKAWALIKKVLHYDPLRGEPVQATTAEILADFLLLIGKEEELRQMQERGTLERTAAWLDTQLAQFLGLLASLTALFSAAWEAIQPENLPNLMSNLQALAGQALSFLESVWTFASNVALTVLAFIKDALLRWLASFANDVPGFNLLTVILGRNPFTGEVVPRTAENLIRGFITLLPNGQQIYQQLAESGAIGGAAARIEGALEQLGISWEFVTGLFRGIWDSLSINDLIDPIGAFARIVAQFGEPISRLFSFISVVLRELFFIILELMHFPTDLIVSIVTNAMQAIESIRNDPVGFLLNMLAAVKQGFSNFFDNILTHLMGGLADWLFRGLRDAGIEPPRDLSLQSVLDFILQVLGISMDRIWQKLADRIGQETVDRIRSAIDRLVGIWTFVRDVQERGVAAIWEYIESQISGLWDMVLAKARDWIMERVINRAIQWLLSLLDPTGIMPVINSFIAFFRAVQSAIQYLRDILEIINDYVTTIASVARGEIGPGAQKVEQGLANAIPVAIGFLANQFGLGNIGEKISEIVAGIREVVDRALDWLVDQAVRAVQAVLRAIGIGGQEEAHGGVGGVKGEAADAVRQQVGQGKSPEELQTIVAAVYTQLQPKGLHALELRPKGEDEYAVFAAASAMEEVLDLAEPQRASENFVTRVTARITIENPLEGLGVRPEQWTPVERQPKGARTVEEFLKMREAMPPEERVAGEVYREQRGPNRRTSTLVARPAEGANEIMIRTFSGTGRRKGFTTDNSSHAEAQLKAFLAGRPDWTARISRIEIQQDYSPCRLCASQANTMGELRSMLTGIRDKSDALLSWSELYPNKHIGTTPEDIARLSADWTISGPQPQGAEAAEVKYAPED